MPVPVIDIRYAREGMLLPPVELSINVCARDLDYFEATYRHIIGQVDRFVSVRRLVVDRRAATGRFVGPSDVGELDRVLARLFEEGLVDDVADVPWDTPSVERIAEKYFGDRHAAATATSGSPIHQYLWAIDTASSDLVFHLDNDMLAHVGDDGAWIRDGIETLSSNDDVVVITPQGGPPRAITLTNWLLGSRFTRAKQQQSLWHKSEGVSTRIMLVDRDRLVSACPLRPTERGELLEQTLTTTLRDRGLARWSRNDDSTWFIHPRRHNRNHTRHLRQLIDAIEAGAFPYRRTGYRWDLRTEGRHFLPWWLLLQRRRVNATLRRALP